MKQDIKRELSRAGGWGVALGILVAVCGLLAIGSPLAAGLTTTVLVGGLLIAAGIVRIVWAFAAPSLGRGILRILFGGITAIAGLALIASPVVGMVSLAILLGIYFVADGITELFAAFDVRPDEGWGWLLFAALVGIGLGAVILFGLPMTGVWTAGVLVGLHLLVAGVTMAVLGAGARQAATPAHT